MSTQPDERWQAYSEQGEPTIPITLEEARAGMLHAASHVWVWRATNTGVQVLLQVRAKDKPTWPGYLDISAAGHQNAGETPLETAVRETAEELGVHVQPEHLRFLFAHRQRMAVLDSKIIENEIQWVYGFPVEQPEHFALLDGEVDSLQWLPLDELKQLADKDIQASNLVPHGPVYFAELFRAIELLQA